MNEQQTNNQSDIITKSSPTSADKISPPLLNLTRGRNSSTVSTTAIPQSFLNETSSLAQRNHRWHHMNRDPSNSIESSNIIHKNSGNESQGSFQKQRHLSSEQRRKQYIQAIHEKLGESTTEKTLYKQSTSRKSSLRQSQHQQIFLTLPNNNNGKDSLDGYPEDRTKSKEDNINYHNNNTQVEEQQQQQLQLPLQESTSKWKRLEVIMQRIRLKKFVRGFLSLSGLRRERMATNTQKALVSDKSNWNSTEEEQLNDTYHHLLLSKSFCRYLSIMPLFQPTGVIYTLWQCVKIISLILCLFSQLVAFAFGASSFESNTISTQWYNQSYSFYNLPSNQILLSCHLILIFDILVTCNTAIYSKGGLCIDRREIFRCYYSSYGFQIDTFTGLSFVLQHIFYYLSIDSALSRLSLIPIILKHTNLDVLLAKVKDAFILDKKKQNGLELISLMKNILLTSHVFACVWIFSAKISCELQINSYDASSKQNTSSSSQSFSWISLAGIDSENWYVQYIYAYYFITVTMITVGYGDIRPSNPLEVCVCIVLMTVCCVVFGFTINSIGEIFQDIFSEEKIIRQKRCVIENYLNKKQISSKVKKGVFEYLEHCWREESDDNASEEQGILAQLSVSLKDAILLESNQIILRDNKILSENFTHDLLLRCIPLVQEERFTPGQIVLDQTAGNVDCQLYFVSSGEVEIYYSNSKRKISNHKSGQQQLQQMQQQQSRVISSSTIGIAASETILGKLSKGSCFGEVEFFTGQKKCLSVRSVNSSRVLKIKREDFKRVIVEERKEYEKFSMMKDILRFHQDFSCLHGKCLCCGEQRHDVNNCPGMHYIPRRLKLFDLCNKSKGVEGEKQERNDGVVRRRKLKMSTFEEEMIVVERLVEFIDDYQKKIEEYEERYFHFRLNGDDDNQIQGMGSYGNETESIPDETTVNGQNNNKMTSGSMCSFGEEVKMSESKGMFKQVLHNNEVSVGQSDEEMYPSVRKINSSLRETQRRKQLSSYREEDGEEKQIKKKKQTFGNISLDRTQDEDENRLKKKEKKQSQSLREIIQHQRSLCGGDRTPSNSSQERSEESHSKKGKKEKIKGKREKISNLSLAGSESRRCLLSRRYNERVKEFSQDDGEADGKQGQNEDVNDGNEGHLVNNQTMQQAQIHLEQKKKKYDEKEEFRDREQDLFEEKRILPSLMYASSSKAKEINKDSMKLPPKLAGKGNKKMSSIILNQVVPQIRTIKHMKSVKITAIKHFSNRKTATTFLTKSYSELKKDRQRQLDNSLSSIKEYANLGSGISMKCVSDESKQLERDCGNKEIEGNIIREDKELSKNDNNNSSHQQYSFPRMQGRPPSLKIPNSYQKEQLLKQLQQPQQQYLQHEKSQPFHRDHQKNFSYLRSLKTSNAQHDHNITNNHHNNNAIMAMNHQHPICLDLFEGKFETMATFTVYFPKFNIKAVLAQLVKVTLARKALEKQFPPSGARKGSSASYSAHILLAQSSSNKCSPLRPVKPSSRLPQPNSQSARSLRESFMLLAEPQTQGTGPQPSHFSSSRFHKTDEIAEEISILNQKNLQEKEDEKKGFSAQSSNLMQFNNNSNSIMNSIICIDQSYIGKKSETNLDAKQVQVELKHKEMQATSIFEDSILDQRRVSVLDNSSRGLVQQSPVLDASVDHLNVSAEVAQK